MVKALKFVSKLTENWRIKTTAQKVHKYSLDLVLNFGFKEDVNKIYNNNVVWILKKE